MPFVNGVKTGYTLGAGYVLVGSATREGVELVSAVLGAPSESERDAATLELLEYGFSLYRRDDAGAARRAALSRRADPVSRRRPGLAPERDVRLTVRDGQRVETEVDAPAEVEGPVDRGERLGLATVTVDGAAGRRACRSRRALGRRRDRARARRRRDPRTARGRLGRRAVADRSRRCCRRRRVAFYETGAGNRLALRPAVILTVTLNAAIDRTVAVPNFRLGQRHRAVEARTVAGGKGVNVARALRLLGRPVIATGLAGGRDRDAAARAAARGIGARRRSPGSRASREPTSR